MEKKEKKTRKFKISKQFIEIMIDIIEIDFCDHKNIAQFLSELETAYIEDYADVDIDQTLEAVAFLSDIDVPEFTGMKDMKKVAAKARQILG